MPTCSICGNVIEKLPPWLDVVNVKFRCSSGKCGEIANPYLFTAAEEEEPAAAPIDGEDDVSLEQEIEAELDESEEEI